jgi:HAD superfamily hydrolase (TIGR01459 family)
MPHERSGPSFSALEDIAERYAAVIMDVWGVLHDGETLYPGVGAGLRFLREKGVAVVLLSNAPRRSEAVKSMLDQMGLGRDLYRDAVTSGEVARFLLSEGKLSTSGMKYALLGPSRDGDVCEGLPGFKRVSSYAEADFAVVTGYDDAMKGHDDVLPVLERLLAAETSVICANPDKRVVRMDGQAELCAGTIVETYRRMGGEACEIGKPFSEVYKYVMGHYLQDTPKHRIACIGDNMDTDIRGAEDFGLDAYLVASGMHAAEIAEAGIEAFLKRFCAVPTGVMEGMRLTAG